MNLRENRFMLLHILKGSRAAKIFQKGLEATTTCTTVYPIVVDILHYEHITKLPMLGLPKFKYERYRVQYEQKESYNVTALYSHNMYCTLQSFSEMYQPFKTSPSTQEEHSLSKKTFTRTFTEQSSWSQKLRTSTD